MCRYRSEVEQLRLNDFFADLDTLKDALAAKRTTTQKQRESDQAPMTASTKRNPDKMKHRATHGSHAYAADNVLSAETEDLLFSRPNAPSGMSLQLVVDLIKDCRQVGSPKLSLSFPAHFPTHSCSLRDGYRCPSQRLSGSATQRCDELGYQGRNRQSDNPRRQA